MHIQIKYLKIANKIIQIIHIIIDRNKNNINKILNKIINNKILKVDMVKHKYRMISFRKNKNIREQV